MAAIKGYNFPTHETSARFRKADHRTARQAGRTARSIPEKHSLGISFEEEIQLIEKKLEETRRQIFSEPHRLAARPTGAPSQTALHAGLYQKALLGFSGIARRPAVCRGPRDGRRFCQAGRTSRHGHRHAKGPRHQGKHSAQFRLRASRRLSQGAAPDAAGEQIRPAHHHAH